MLDSYQFDRSRCWRELREFGELIATHHSLDEAKDILPFFSARSHLLALVGTLIPDILLPDKLGTEFDLFGDFACDFVVGDSSKSCYCLIEFENANPQSVFQRASRGRAPYWSRRFEHGWSQVIDWMWKLDNLKNTQELRHRFGTHAPFFFGMLICGRSEPLAQRERDRLAWRSEHVVVHSKRIYCLTLDQLFHDLLRIQTIHEAWGGMMDA